MKPVSRTFAHCTLLASFALTSACSILPKADRRVIDARQPGALVATSV